eukprot:31085-Pelagococcus_subviridis.AAC.24
MIHAVVVTLASAALPSVTGRPPPRRRRFPTADCNVHEYRLLRLQKRVLLHDVAVTLDPHAQRPVRGVLHQRPHVHANRPRVRLDVRVIPEILRDLLREPRYALRVVVPHPELPADDPLRLPRYVDHGRAEKETVRHRRRTRVFRDERGLVPPDLFHEVTADVRLVRASEPSVHGHEVNFLSGAERLHDREHDAAEVVAYEILRG